MRRIDLPPALPERLEEGHKGLFGRVLVVGGSRDMIGAPVLAGLAALRMGAGLVQVAMPRPVLAAALTVCPELIGLGLTKGTRERLDEAAALADAIVVGPGLGVSRESHDRLRSLTRLNKPLVIDADGLNVLAAGKRWPAKFEASAVLTPHPGEMKRLGSLIDLNDVPADDAGRIRIAVQAASEFQQVVVLKGARTVVVEPPTPIQPVEAAKVFVNSTGDSSLSKAGTGDVLAGLIACLMAQKLPRFEAACAAVYLHGLAGEIAGARLGKRSVLATDVIESLPQAIAEYERRLL